MNDLFDRWIKHVSLTPADRQVYLDKLHPEVKNGFNILAAIVMSEFQNKLVGDLEAETLEHLEISLSHLVYAGYFLAFEESQINILQTPYLDSEKSSYLGNELMQILKEYENPNLDTLELLAKDIPAKILGFLLLYRTTYSNKIILLDNYLNQKPHAVMSLINTYLFWILVMGYKLGQLEIELNRE